MDRPRDETAFSIDSTTGAPTADGATRQRAEEAMAALAEGKIDEAAYNQVVAGEARLSDVQLVEEAAAEPAASAPTPEPEEPQPLPEPPTPEPEA